MANNNIALFFRLILPPKDSSLSQYFLKEKDKPGSIYEKIYKNNINELESFFDDEAGLEHMVNEMKLALSNYKHQVLSYKQYHCKVPYS